MTNTTALRPTQRHRVLSMLARAGAAGVDGMDFYRGDDIGELPNGRTRCYELIDDRHHIEIVPCTRDHAYVDRQGRAVPAPSHRVYIHVHGPERECPTCPWRPAQLQLMEAV